MWDIDKQACVRGPSWKLFKRRTKNYEGRNYFHEKWVDPITKSGMVFYSTLSDSDKKNFYGYKHPKGNVYFVVEGYGKGTISQRTFKEIGPSAPIERYEFEDKNRAKAKLKEMQSGMGV